MRDALSPLAALGPRIAIIGVSNSGKSTLANALSAKTSLPVVHLDRLHHPPGTHWQPRPKAAFLRLHQEAIEQDRWIIEGNYSACMPERLGRATGAIMLDIGLSQMLIRYVRRTLFEHDRAGSVLAAHQQDRITRDMLHFLIFTTRANRQRLRKTFEALSLPKICLASPKEVKTCYNAWAL